MSVPIIGEIFFGETIERNHEYVEETIVFYMNCRKYRVIGKKRWQAILFNNSYFHPTLTLVAKASNTFLSHCAHVHLAGVARSSCWR